MSYALDTNSARKADQTGRFIKEIGKYIGKFTRAEDIKASTGTQGIAFTFEADGQSANLSIYTLKSDGEKLMGHDVLMAIMTCMKCREINPVKGKVTKWNNDLRADETVDALVFPELMNKPVGLLLETEDYIKRDGSTSTRMVIAGVFQADTELTASEILDKKVTPEQLPKRVAALRHRPAKAAKGGSAPAKTGGTGHFDDMSDDIPFALSTGASRDNLGFSKSLMRARHGRINSALFANRVEC